MAAPVAPAVAMPHIVVAERVFKRLGEHARLGSDSHQGFLYGYTDSSGAVNVIGCMVSTSLTEKNFFDELAKNSSYFPVGINPVGIFVLGGHNAANLNSVVPPGVHLLTQHSFNSTPTVEPLLVWLFPDSTGDSRMCWYDVDTCSSLAASFVIDNAVSTYENHVMFRVRGNVKIAIEHSSDPQPPSVPIAIALSDAKRKLSSNIVSYTIRSGSGSVLLYRPKSGSASTTDSDDPVVLVATPDRASSSVTTCADLQPLPQRSLQQKKKWDVASTSPAEDTIDVDMLFALSTDSAIRASPDCTPVLFCDQKSLSVSTVCLPMDVLAVVERSARVDKLPDVFRRGLLNQLDRMQAALTSLYQNNQLSNPVPYHFKPAESLHHVTVVYCDGESDADLEAYRRCLHQKLLLPADRPLFRRANRCWINSNRLQATSEASADGGGEGGRRSTRPGDSGGQHLRNVHCGLPQSGVKDGRVSCVRGSYAYHHYMQDSFDDAGWGCAYRSLQTVVSWFRLQGYTNVGIPTHRQIQEALVAVGDKPPTFVGSKQWIGSLEVSYCLDKMFGVTSKILFVSSGAELAVKARELSQHFESQGTPIMIGGGVLAHTILGVDYSDVSGDVRFLVLDPHYTGGEDLRVIQDKGWCGWKGPTFWDPSAHYNLCMPQRPVVI